MLLMLLLISTALHFTQVTELKSTNTHTNTYTNTEYRMMLCHYVTMIIILVILANSGKSDKNINNIFQNIVLSYGNLSVKSSL